MAVVEVSSLASAIEVYVSLLIPKSLILKTSPTDKIHIIFIPIFSSRLLSLYTLCEANLFLDKVLNSVQLCHNLSHLSLIQAVCKILPLVVSVFGLVARRQVLYQSHSLF